MTAPHPILSVLLTLVAPLPLPAADAVKVQFHVRVPESTPPTSRVYLAGGSEELGVWKPDGVELRRHEDGTYRGTLVMRRGVSVEYKLTRGSWETVEKDTRGQEMPNRILTPEQDEVIHIAIARFANPDAQPATARKSTKSGDVRAHESVPSRSLDNRRTVWVWVPPGYSADLGARYPVLYMHDGRNVFDAATSFAGEWQADETADRLIRTGRIERLIIVAVDNNADRVGEYTTSAMEGDGGKGDAYARFLVEELKPFIDRTYRTKPGREHTAVAGSSLGGLISLHVARRYPEHIGMCGVVSPALWWDDERLLKELEAGPEWARGIRIWLDMGTNEGTGLSAGLNVGMTRRLAAALKAEGVDHTYREVEGGTHTEAAWSQRFDEVLTFFFAAR